MRREEEERLIPVRSESELRPGMLVVNKLCESGKHTAHRHMLIDSAVDEVYGDIVWGIQPPVDCDGEVVDGFAPAKSIERGRLFIVDTDHRDEADILVAKPVKSPARERAR